MGKWYAGHVGDPLSGVLRPFFGERGKVYGYVIETILREVPQRRILEQGQRDSDRSRMVRLVLPGQFPFRETCKDMEHPERN